MATITVGSAAQLNTVLKAARSGDVILLQAGAYAGVTIKDLALNGVTITSQDPAHAAVLTGLRVSGSSGVTFSNLEFSSAGAATSSPFVIDRSSGIVIDHVSVHGSLNGTPADDVRGLVITNSTNVVVSKTEFQQLSHGIYQLNNSGLEIVSNAFHDIRTDGVDGGGTSNLLIANNTFTDFHPSSSGQHPDAIQLWTTNTTQSAHDITITGNTISRGSGDPTQGIFISDQVGNLPYRNVTITDNVVVGALSNGISVHNTEGLLIQGNTITSAESLLSKLIVSDSTGVSLLNNDVTHLGWTSSELEQQSGNKVAGVLQSGAVTSSVTCALSGLDTQLVLTGSSAITGTGNNSLGSKIVANDAGDKLNGGRGDDFIIGGAGKDYITGKGGNDLLVGGGGDDTFQFLPGAGHDVIADLSGHDRIELRSFLAAGYTPVAHDVGDHAVISFIGEPTTITLLGVHAADLVATYYGFLH